MIVGPQGYTRFWANSIYREKNVRQDVRFLRDRDWSYESKLDESLFGQGHVKFSAGSFSCLAIVYVPDNDTE